MTFSGGNVTTKFHVPVKNWPHVQAILVAYNVEAYFLIRNDDGGVVVELRSEFIRDVYTLLHALSA